jgi:hypothetical protein
MWKYNDRKDGLFAELIGFSAARKYSNTGRSAIDFAIKAKLNIFRSPTL